MKRRTELHIHSNMSVMDGLTDIKMLLEKADSIFALSLFDELKAISMPAKKAESKSDDTITMKIVIYTS